MDDDSYCQVCHRSDPRGRKHVYTKKHKERINAVLRKFEVKMLPAKNCIVSGPTVLKCDPSEAEEKFWCPFCSAEVIKHERLGQVTAHFKSWAEHLCSSEHHKKVHNFFWTNKLDMKKRDKYKLNEESSEMLQSQSKKNYDKFSEDSVVAVQKEATRIREVELQRSTLTVPSTQRNNLEPEVGLRAAGQLVTIPASSRGRGGSSFYHSNPMGHTMNTHLCGGYTTYHTNREINTSNQLRENKIDRRISNSTSHQPSVLINEHSHSTDIDSHGLPSAEGTWGAILCSPSTTPTVGASTSRSNHPVKQIFSLGHDSNIPGSSNSSGAQAQGGWNTTRTCSKLTVSSQDVLAMGAWSSLPGSSQSEIDPLLKMKATKVISSGGLTVISRKKSKLRGNIHTGSLPPWLQDEDEAEKKNQEGASSVIIGPTAEDLQKHLETEKKRKLNPNRVGANFDHYSKTADEWLPSFGRVWNEGPRWRSRKQYRKEAGSKIKKTR